MAALRRKLRLFVTTWLVCQVAWLAALGPHACCAPERAVQETCHESVPQPPPDCRLVGSCEGPLAALLTGLFTSGVLPDETSAAADAAVHSVPAPSAEHTAGQFVPADPPPPRA